MVYTRVTPQHGKLFLWLALLFVESEFLAINRYEMRTQIRELLHFPVYHLLFATLACALFLRAIWPEASRTALPQRYSGRWLAVHLGYYAVLASHIDAVWPLLRSLPDLLQLSTWLAVLGLFVTSWFGIAYRPAVWLAMLRDNSLWLGVSLLLGLTSMGVAHASTWLWQPLASGTLGLSTAMLNLCYDDVVSMPESLTVGTSTFTIVIAPGCSGYQGIGLMVFFSLIFLWLRRRELRMPHSLLLLPLGIGINWLLNSLRIAMLVIIGTNISSYLALKGFHSQAGWLAFTLTSVGLTLLVEKAGWFRAAGVAAESGELPAPAEYDYPAAPYLVPLLTLLFGGMTGAALTIDFDWFYPIRISATAIACVWSCTVLKDLGKRPSWQAVLCGLAVYVLWIAMVPSAATATAWDYVSNPLAIVWIFFRALGSSVAIPIAEELAFRGYLLPRLQDAFQGRVRPALASLLGLVLSSALFAALHQDLAAAFIAGLAYGLVYKLRGSLLDAMVAHGVTNACISIQVLVLGHWYLWG